ncbi:MAG: CHASE2 domain-containing protein [Symploca sp. SIO2G7]|nr:CHASE2 domain-containing protein [Symploca sp. SIO2G7]
MNRDELLDNLCSCSSGTFDRVVAYLKPPAGTLSSERNSQATRAAELLIWAEHSDGPSLEKLEKCYRRAIGEQPAKVPIKHSKRSLWEVILTSLLISGLTTGLVLGMRSLGLLESLELEAYDHLLQLRPAEQLDEHILVVEVNQEDINEYGSYPLEDTKLAELISKLEQYQPRVIGVDMHRYTKRGQGREQLIAQFRENSDIITVCKYGSQSKDFYPPSEFSKEQLRNQVGFSNLPLDGAGKQVRTIRRQLLSYAPKLSESPHPCSTPFSFSLQLAYRFLDKEGIQPMTLNDDDEWEFGGVVFKPLTVHFGGYQQLNGQSDQIMINYRSSSLPGRKVTFKQVLEGQVNRDDVKDRIVLIGMNVEKSGDIHDTPYREMLGVWIQAHMVSQIIRAVIDERPLIWVLPQWRGVLWGETFWILAWSSVGGLIVWRFQSRLKLILLICGITTLVLHQICLVILSTSGGWMPLVPSGLGLIFTTVSSSIAYKYLFKHKQ